MKSKTQLRLCSMTLCILIMLSSVEIVTATTYDETPLADAPGVVTEVAATYKEAEHYSEKEIEATAKLASGLYTNLTVAQPDTPDGARQHLRTISFAMRCVVTGESTATRGFIRYATKGDAISSGIRVQYEPNGLNGLESDPRVIAELETVNNLSSFEEKVYEIETWVANQADYDYDSVSYLKEHGVFPEGFVSDTAMGCLNGTAICQGYANLASYLYKQAGIESVKVMCAYTDIHGARLSHILNAVKNPDGQILMVDSCFYSNMLKKTGSTILTPDEYAKYVGGNFEYTVNISDLFTITEMADQLVAEAATQAAA